MNGANRNTPIAAISTNYLHFVHLSDNLRVLNYKWVNKSTGTLLSNASGRFHKYRVNLPKKIIQ